MRSIFAQFHAANFVIAAFCFGNVLAGSGVPQPDVTGNAVDQGMEAGSATSSDPANDGFLNGVKYGMSYPFVFWGAEGYVKIPLNKMTGSFTFGYLLALACMLLVAGSIFLFKKSRTRSPR